MGEGVSEGLLVKTFQSMIDAKLSLLKLLALQCETGFSRLFQ